LVGLLAHDYGNNVNTRTLCDGDECAVAELAYAQADAMLKAREAE